MSGFQGAISLGQSDSRILPFWHVWFFAQLVWVNRFFLFACYDMSSFSFLRHSLKVCCHSFHIIPYTLDIEKMAVSSSSSSDDPRIPRKRMIDTKRITVVDTVRSIGDRSCDSWNGNTAMDRIEVDMSIYRVLTEVLLSMFKGDSEEESKCSKTSISLLAYAIKQKFDDDVFIASKYMFNNISIYKIAAEHFLTKQQVQLWVVLLSQKVGHMPTRFNALFFLRSVTRSYDEKCQFGLTLFLEKPSWYFLVI